jgi:hypothetical protein
MKFGAMAKSPKKEMKSSTIWLAAAVIRLILIIYAVWHDSHCKFPPNTMHLGLVYLSCRGPGGLTISCCMHCSCGQVHRRGLHCLFRCGQICCRRRYNTSLELSMQVYATTITKKTFTNFRRREVVCEGNDEEIPKGPTS